MLVTKKYPILYKKQHKKRSIKKDFFFKNTYNWVCPKLQKKLNKSIYYIYPKTSFILPKNFMIFFKRYFKKFFKKKNIKCLFLFNINVTLSTKHKNSRMGKGVGRFKRHAVQIKKNSPFILLYNISEKRAHILTHFLSSRLGQKFFIFKKIY